MKSNRKGHGWDQDHIQPWTCPCCWQPALGFHSHALGGLQAGWAASVMSTVCGETQVKRGRFMCPSCASSPMPAICTGGWEETAVPRQGSARPHFIKGCPLYCHPPIPPTSTSDPSSGPVSSGLCSWALQPSGCWPPLAWGQATANHGFQVPAHKVVLTHGAQDWALNVWATGGMIPSQQPTEAWPSRPPHRLHPPS